MFLWFRKQFVMLCIFFLLSIFQMHARADELNQIVFFGDSLSDPGNVYIEEGMTSQPPYGVIPIYPYNIGGFQFTNGRTWAQRFAREMGLRKSGKPALKRPGRYTNYAFGDARARDFGDRPSAMEQLGLFLTDCPGPVDNNTLFVIQFGANDIRDALDSPVDSVEIISAAIGTKASMIIKLYDLGARKFLVTDVPDLSLTPAIRLQAAISPFPELVITGTRQLVTEYNNALEYSLQTLEGTFADIQIKRLSFSNILNELVNNSDDYNLQNTEEACIKFGVIESPICSRRNRFLFWDGIHPTRKVHHIVGQFAADLYD